VCPTSPSPSTGSSSSSIDGFAKALAGGYARIYAGLKAVGEPQLRDDRKANRFELRMRFELPEFGAYNRGFIDTEYLVLELMDVLIGPNEAQRRTPFLVDQARQVDSRVVVVGPAPFQFAPPAPLEIVDRQFRFSARIEINGRTAQFVRRYERREDQVATSRRGVRRSCRRAVRAPADCACRCWKPRPSCRPCSKPSAACAARAVGATTACRKS
jgi:hypothetical protein